MTKFAKSIHLFSSCMASTILLSFVSCKSSDNSSSMESMQIRASGGHYECKGKDKKGKDIAIEFARKLENDDLFINSPHMNGTQVLKRKPNDGTRAVYSLPYDTTVREIDAGPYMNLSFPITILTQGFHRGSTFETKYSYFRNKNEVASELSVDAIVSCTGT